MGVVVLEDASMQLEYNGEKVTLIGLSDPSFTLKGNMLGEVPAMVDTKLRGLIGDKDDYTILLSHRPELFETYVNCGVDLVLRVTHMVVSFVYHLLVVWLLQIKAVSKI